MLLGERHSVRSMVAGVCGEDVLEKTGYKGAGAGASGSAGAGGLGAGGGVGSTSVRMDSPLRTTSGQP